MTRKETQQLLGRQKSFQTARNLAAALDRMYSGKVVNLPLPFAFTKQNLAIEAGIDEATLYRKKDGAYMYADILAAFSVGKPAAAGESKDYLRRENAALREQLLRYQRTIVDLNAQVERMSGRVA